MVYNRGITAERLSDMRQEKNLSYIKLSEGIERKTGVYISATQLQKYENIEKHTRDGNIVEITDVMNVRNLLALSDFYEVSPDYLLGRSSARERKYHCATEITGLSEGAIKALEGWSELVDSAAPNGATITHSTNTKAPGEISSIIESRNFRLLIAYIRSLKNTTGTVGVNNSILGPAKVETLKREIGTAQVREYIMYQVLNSFRDIVNEIVPLSGPDSETRTATQSDFDDF